MSGIHNGHTIIGGQWLYANSKSVNQDTNKLEFNDVLDLNGYVDQEYVAVVACLEYEIELLSLHEVALLGTNINRSRALNIVVSSYILIPFNGRHTIWMEYSNPSVDCILIPSKSDLNNIVTDNFVDVQGWINKSKSSTMLSNDIELSFSVTRTRNLSNDADNNTEVASKMKHDNDSEDIKVLPTSFDESDSQSTNSFLDNKSDLSILELNSANFNASYLGSTKYPRMETKNNLLSKSLSLKLLHNNSDENSDILFSDSGLKQDFKSPKDESMESHNKSMTRSSKARFDRIGFNYFSNGNASKVNVVDSKVNYRNDAFLNNISMDVPIDIKLEVDDPLSISEIAIQFAGFRSDSINSEPKSIFCTFQFYSCMSTKTEIYVPTAHTQDGFKVLARERASQTYDTPIALVFFVDKNKHPLEKTLFSDYLASSYMTIDVWDADNSFLIGSCNVN